MSADAVRPGAAQSEPLAPEDCPLIVGEVCPRHTQAHVDHLASLRRGLRALDQCWCPFFGYPHPAHDIDTGSLS